MSRSRTLRLLVVTTAFAAFLLCCAAVAVAGTGPSDPVLHFSDLRSELATAPGHVLEGYMSTVATGSEITTIGLQVVGVPQTGDAEHSLIMFNSDDPLIQQYGGIVAGMSGSPVYVKDPNDGDAYKLVGAVSYGDYFTLGGTGLATPIDAMTALENAHGTEVVPLSSPIITAGGVVNKIIVAPNPQDYAGAAAMGAFVAKPLFSLFIGGLRPTSSGYKALAKDLSKRGIGTVSLGSALNSGVGDGTPLDTTLTAGASIAAMVSRGDMWEGGIGTVTYADGSNPGDNVLAFGHPAFWTGPTALYMMNASIDGIWPSSYEPYKMGEPGALKGTITQDREHGILGKVGLPLTETTITACATNLDSASPDTTSSTVEIPTQLFLNGFADGYLAGDAAYMAGYKLFDDAGHSGSAHTTTTVDVMNRNGDTYHITIPDYVDSSYDIAYDASYDVLKAVENLQSVLQWGVDDPKIVAIHLEGEYRKTRAAETIVGVDAPNGIHVGDNPVVVQELVYGDPDTQTVDTTVTVPAGTAVGGSLVAESPSAAQSDGSLSSIFVGDPGIMLDIYGYNVRESVAQIAKRLNDSKPNNTLLVTFQPGQSDLLSSAQGDSSGGGDSGGGLADTVAGLKNALSTDPISFVLGTHKPTYGRAHADITAMLIQADPSVLSYGDFTDVLGEIEGPDVKSVVSLYATESGSTTETLVATQTVSPVQGVLPFDFPLDELFTNTTFRVHVDAGYDPVNDTGWTTGDAIATVHVRAMTSLSVSASHIKPGKSVKLTALVRPTSAAGGTVIFEQQVGRSWKKVASAKLVASGSAAKAVFTWKPAKGAHKVRARYTGGTFNYTSNSITKTITVK